MLITFLEGSYAGSSWKNKYCCFVGDITIIPFLLRTLFTMTLTTGVIQMNTTFLEGRLGLTRKRPSYRATGTHPSQRSVLE